MRGRTDEEPGGEERCSSDPRSGARRCRVKASVLEYGAGSPPGTGAAAPKRWWTLWRSVGGIRIVHVDLAGARGWQTRVASEWLDSGERARWQRFRVEHARRRFAFCRGALRAVLCAELGCPNRRLGFEYHGFGKPFAVVGSAVAPVSFNVSHSGDHGLIALAERGQLGVDAEVRALGRNMAGIGRSVFGPNEQAALGRARGREKVRLFYALWTMKEALIKALGSGFSLRPSGFEVPAAMRRGVKSGLFRFPHEAAPRWRLVRLGGTRFAAALAYEEGEGARW